MKYRITLKDPEAMWNVYDEDSQKMEFYTASDIFRNWFEYNEYVTLELDTDTNEIRVLEAN